MNQRECPTKKYTSRPKLTWQATATILLLAQLLFALSIRVCRASPEHKLQSPLQKESSKPASTIDRQLAGRTSTKANSNAHVASAALKFSAIATDQEISRATIAGQPLVPASDHMSAKENQALGRTLAEFSRRTKEDDTESLESFLKAYPNSRWRISLFAGLATNSLEAGRFSKALSFLEKGWKLGKDETDPKIREISGWIGARLAKLNAQLGRANRAASLLRQFRGREISGSATELITSAAEGLSLMKNKPEEARRCGPTAAAMLYAANNPTTAPPDKLRLARATSRGTSLNQVAKLMNSVGLKYRMAKRTPRSAILTPCIINWRVGHFAAVLRRERDKYLVADPTFGKQLWVSAEAIDAEASGYFLVPAGTLPLGWRTVAASEGSQVWGAGQTYDTDPDNTKPCDMKSGGSGTCSTCSSSSGMASYSFHSATVSLNIVDTPLFYNQPRGPSVSFTVTYNQRDANQPAGTFPFSNLGPKWTFNWLSFIIDDSTNPYVNPKVYMQGGGAETYQNYNPQTGMYDPGIYSQAILVRISGTSYERRLPDGSKETFDRPDATVGAGRRVFLTRITDPAGNSITFSYDDSFRLRTMTDAVDKQTIFSYTDPNDIRRITSITDPFQRVATFEYFPNAGRLKKITDMGGLTSEFTYGTGSKADFITSLTTVYGTTNFRYDDDGTDPSLPPRTRWLQATDPIGGVERIEYNENSAHNGIPSSVSDPIPCGLYNRNSIMYARNTFFWSKKAMSAGGVSQSCVDTPYYGCGTGDYAKSQLLHWLHSTYQGNQYYYSGGIIESEKKPLEARIWYNYPGQPQCTGQGCCPSPYNEGATLTGTSSRPTKVGRVLDDGTTQLNQYQYNAAGRLAIATDPAGRVTSYLYAANNIDLLRVFQRNPNGAWIDPYSQHADKVAEYTYDPGDPPHLPHTYIDAAGQTTTYSYDSYGELLTLQNARGEVTIYGYGDGTSGHPVGYLTSITGPAFNGISPVTSFSYDSANRVCTVRNDPDSYQVTIDYDNLDRPTQITYPDSTTEQFQYTDSERGMTLDLTASKDRLDRWTHRHYNANRQMDSITDPLNHITQFDWCTCGLLNGIIDANQNTTRFDHDVQSRVTSKTFAYGTPQTQTISYIYENTTSRVKSMTDAMSQTTHYYYWKDDDLKEVIYTGAQNPTPNIHYEYNPYYNRVASVSSSGAEVIYGTISYTYYPVTVAGTLGANKVQTVGGLFTGDTITYSYDQLGRTTGQSINGVSSSVAFDSLGRLGTSDNTLGHFDRTYDGVTPRLQRLTYPSGVMADYSYFDNLHDRRLQTLRNSMGNGTTTLSQFDYTYDPEGQIQTLAKNLSGYQTPLSLGYDDAKRLTSVSSAIQQFIYSYDAAANRYDVRNLTNGGVASDTYYTVNHLNQLDTVSVNGAPPVPLNYDGNGNLTDDAAGKTYEWDAANRLVAVNYTATGTRTEFAYDGLGRRVKVTEYGAGMTATVQPKGTDYTLFTSEPFTLPAGSYTLSFEGLNPATTGNTNTALVDDVRLNGTLLANGGFETPVVQNYQVAPTGSSWSYSGISGIAGNGSTLTSGNPPAPEGSQVAFVQNDGSISQTATIAAGTYTLTFKVAQRSGNETYQRVRVSLRAASPVLPTKTFVWSGSAIAEERDTSGATVMKRFFAEGEQRIGGTDAGNYYYTRDHLGSVREVMDATGTLKGQYDYDAWGSPVVVKGKMQVDFGYTGHYFHQPSGLNLAMYRAYNPTLGRWINRDPLRNAEVLQGPNLYAYVRNSPMLLTDRLGLQTPASHPTPIRTPAPSPTNGGLSDAGEALLRGLGYTVPGSEFLDAAGLVPDIGKIAILEAFEHACTDCLAQACKNPDQTCDICDDYQTLQSRLTP